MIPYCKEHVTPAAGEQLQRDFEHFHVIADVTPDNERILYVLSTTKLLTPEVQAAKDISIVRVRDTVPGYRHRDHVRGRC